MKNFVTRTLDWQIINDKSTVFNVEKIIWPIETKEQVIKSVEKILANRIEEQEEEITTNSHAKDKEEIIDYTDKEKEELDELMKKVYLINDEISQWKPIHGYTQLWNFIIWYRHLSPRLKVHFKKIYEELVLLLSEQKIKHLLDNHFNGFENNIIMRVNDILEIKPDFDFSIFNSKKLNDILKNAKKVK